MHQITCSGKHKRDTRPTIVVCCHILNKEQNQNQEILENSTNPRNSLCRMRPRDLKLPVVSPEKATEKRLTSQRPNLTAYRVYIPVVMVKVKINEIGKENCFRFSEFSDAGEGRKGRSWCVSRTWGPAGPGARSAGPQSAQALARGGEGQGWAWKANYLSTALHGQVGKGTWCFRGCWQLKALQDQNHPIESH